MGIRRSLAGAMAVLALNVFTETAQAEITRIEIDRVESPAFEGRSFGTVGQYELLVGRAFGEVDPKDPRHAGIVYIDRAPRNDRGMVEYETDVHILKPIELARGNQTIFYGVVNRGGRPSFSSLLLANTGSAGPRGDERLLAEHAGDGLLMRHGFTFVWSGWHGDVRPVNGRIIARLPVVRNPDGSPIRKRIILEFLINGGVGRPPLYTVSGGRRVLDDFYPAVEESMGDAALLRRRGPHGDPEEMPRDEWSFANCPDGGQGIPSNKHLCVPAGFSPDYLYSLVYEAQDPHVQGLGFAVTRDFVSFLRHDTSDRNPLASEGRNPIRWTMAFGSSQSGRFLRHMLHEGLNEDEASRIVFDGMMSRVSGGRRGFFNHEFAQTTRWSLATEEHYQPGDEFPFAYEVLTDPITGETDGLLARCRKTKTCPKIMQVDNAVEVWQARASLVLTDPLGKKDVPLPANVRYYVHSSLQHDPAETPSAGICQYPPNPNRDQETLRALTIALRNWIALGLEPPESRHPRVADGTLVPARDVRFPRIPGVTYTAQYNHKLVNDYSVLPPRHVPETEYGVLVPQVDSDGNDIAGIRTVTIQAPLGTYTGWNLRRDGFMEGLLCMASGSFFPFAVTAAERGDDPRPSLEERYGTHEAYVQRVIAAGEQLVRNGYLLQEDYFRIVAEAEQTDIGLPRERDVSAR